MWVPRSGIVLSPHKTALSSMPGYQVLKQKLLGLEPQDSFKEDRAALCRVPATHTPIQSIE
jgi:hypothetical protein